MAGGVRKYKPGSVYHITWLDHHDIQQTWIKASDIPDNHEVRFSTVGICVKDEELCVTLAGTVQMNCSDPDYGNVFRCMKANIQTSKEIKI